MNIRYWDFALPISHSRLLEVLNYDRKTGIFTWKVTTSSKATAGSVAGCPHNHGYWRIKIDGEIYLAHRLAWFYCQKKWPPSQVDHKNGKRSDNRRRNLRLASHSQNQTNRGPASNQTGHTGVYLNAKTGRYYASINKNKKYHYLGSFDSLEDAVGARVAAEKKLHKNFAQHLGAGTA